VKAIIGIMSWDQTRSELWDLARRIDAGEWLGAADNHLDYATPAEAFRRMDQHSTIPLHVRVPP
jgi:hypothetical protein